MNKNKKESFEKRYTSRASAPVVTRIYLIYI